MEALVTRNFRVKGTIRNLFTPPGGSEVPKYFANLKVELWQKGPLDVTFLGSGLTEEGGEFMIDFKRESPTTVIDEGKIDGVFLKIYYRGKVITGEIASEGSFD